MKQTCFLEDISVYTDKTMNIYPVYYKCVYSYLCLNTQNYQTTESGSVDRCVLHIFTTHFHRISCKSKPWIRMELKVLRFGVGVGSQHSFF